MPFPLLSQQSVHGVLSITLIQKEKKRKDYTFRRQFNEKPSITPGCSGTLIHSRV